VHNVKAMKTVAEVVDAIRQSTPEDEEQPVIQTRWQRGQ